MERRFTVASVHPNAYHDAARRETSDSLLDGRAKWPDGSPREIGAPLYERTRAAMPVAQFEIVMPDGTVHGPFKGPRELRIAARSLPAVEWTARVVGCE